MNIFNNVILAMNRQLPDDDQMIETCWSIFRSFNVNNLSVCIGWYADQDPSIFQNVSMLEHCAIHNQTFLHCKIFYYNTM